MQFAADGKGITCQKLGEAEVMADAGIMFIIITTNLLGAAASGFQTSLQTHISLRVYEDNLMSNSLAIADAPIHL